ncbi:MAG: glucose-1-phosphate thymidylyltransferase [Brumimicrobium sp.]|nr:glucose-1-phosphate thymidylyltransferase [Brumimicrobium sp.]MCO5268091.1 glucose-1-phosphate thymidylyltransferase [Brumimicrobium sp.]
MNIILHDLSGHLTFAPLTLTRPVGKLRTGMWTNEERWQFYCPQATISFMTKDYLSEKYSANITKDNLWVNAAVIPTNELVKNITDLKKGESLYINNAFIAYRGEEYLPVKPKSSAKANIIILENRWDIYQKNDQILAKDFQAYTAGKKSQAISDTNTIIGDAKRIFLEKGAKVECAILNVSDGPIYVGKNAEIMEGSIVRGGLIMLEESILKIGSKIYGATTIGPHCRVGGEVNNSIFQGYSNKGHDGFIGNSVIGEWCNLGADTNCSNLKNNYGNVKTYNYFLRELEQTNVQFMGVMMGDYSKTSINTMINTASVIGVCANIFMSGFPPKYVADFSWGGEPSAPVYELASAYESIHAMMQRRHQELTDEDKRILAYLYP